MNVNTMATNRIQNLALLIIYCCFVARKIPYKDSRNHASNFVNHVKNMYMQLKEIKCTVMYYNLAKFIILMYICNVVLY